MTYPKHWEKAEAGILCKLILEHDGRHVSDVPRELLRKRSFPTNSPNPPPRSAVCDMRELMRLVSRWTFSHNGITSEEILLYHELPVATYNKCGRVTCGGEQRRQYAERAYKYLIQSHAFFDAVDVRDVLMWEVCIFCSYAYTILTLCNNDQHKQVMRALDNVFLDASSARWWLRWLMSQPGSERSACYNSHLQALCPMDADELVIKAGNDAARYAPTPEERGKLTAMFVKALESNTQMSKETILNPRLSQNYLPYKFVATTANTICHAFGPKRLSPFALSAAFQNYGTSAESVSSKRRLFSSNVKEPASKRARVPLGGGPLMGNLLKCVELAGAGKALRLAAHVSRMHCKSGSKHRKVVAPALNKASLMSGYVGIPAPGLEKEIELMRRSQPHVRTTAFSYPVQTDADKPSYPTGNTAVMLELAPLLETELQSRVRVQIRKCKGALTGWLKEYFVFSPKGDKIWGVTGKKLLICNQTDAQRTKRKAFVIGDSNGRWYTTPWLLKLLIPDKFLFSCIGLVMTVLLSGQDDLGCIKPAIFDGPVNAEGTSHTKTTGKSMHNQYREILRQGIRMTGNFVEVPPPELINNYKGWISRNLFLPVEHDLFCGDGKGIRSLLATVGVSSAADLAFWCKVLRPDRHLQLALTLRRRFGSFPGVSARKQNKLWKLCRGDKEKQLFLKDRAGITGINIWVCDEMCLDSGHVSGGIFHVSTYDKRVMAVVAMVCSYNGCLDPILKHWHECVKIGGNFDFDHWPNGTLSIKFSDCEKLLAFMQLSYERLFTCTHTDCVGRAFRHRQTFKDSCISISDPDTPLQVGDAITHRRSCHPGTVVAVPHTGNRVFINFDGQPKGESQLVNRRECKKRPRVDFLMQHQIKHLKFILTRLSEIHNTLEHRIPGEHYEKVIQFMCRHLFCFCLSDHNIPNTESNLLRTPRNSAQHPS